MRSGSTPWSAEGTAERQGWVADLADDGLFGTKGEAGFARSADWRTEADRILGEGQAEGLSSVNAVVASPAQAGTHTHRG